MKVEFRCKIPVSYGLGRRPQKKFWEFHKSASLNALPSVGSKIWFRLDSEWKLPDVAAAVTRLAEFWEEEEKPGIFQINVHMEWDLVPHRNQITLDDATDYIEKFLSPLLIKRGWRDLGGWR